MNHNSTYYTDLITRYFSGETTEEELRLLSEWLKDDPENEVLFTQFRKTWQLVEKQKINASVNSEKEWALIQKKMAESSSAKEAHAKFISADHNKKIIKLSFQKTWKVAAAITILLASSFLLYNYFSKPANIVVTAQNSNMEQVLPDGSVVSLHAGSQIKYPATFASNSRKVELIGEAYFKVTHDKTKPFIVSYGDANVEVIGTQFNVNTHASTGNMEVVLTSGKVSAYFNAHPKDNIVLVPGEKAVLTAEQNLISKSTNTDPNYMAWKTKVLVFDNETLAQVVNTLQSVYQTPVTLADNALAECRVTASFNGQSLQSVLQVIKETLDLQVKQNGKTIEISGKSCK